MTCDPTPDVRAGLALLCLALSPLACGGEPVAPLTLEALGEALFFDARLSKNGSQSCATCHDPDRAFVDSRLDAHGNISAVSLGADGRSLGARNAPTLAYAAVTKPFQMRATRHRVHELAAHRTYEGPLGGMFWDGRAPGLEDQAGRQPLSASEMGMTDEASVIHRIAADPDYALAFRTHFSPDVFDDPESAYVNMTQAIAAFERRPAFAPFDSRYDRSLRGQATLSAKERAGKALFFSVSTSCAICHQLHDEADPVGRFRETFSGFEFHNLGVPANRAVLAHDVHREPDLGLALNPHMSIAAARGRFRTPTLRNVAVTEPYMHNGVFRDLRTVVEFYAKQLDPLGRPDNPETGLPWAEPEVPETVAHELLQVGDPLADEQIEALVCFLRTLTDARYEPLIQDKGIECRN